jgi:heterotetrameric sarcosine oxidase gamma subunit
MTKTYTSRHPLEGRIPLDPGIRAVDHLEVPRRQAIVTVMAADGEETAVAAALTTMSEASLRSVGPGEWLVVSQSETPDGLLRSLSLVLADTAYALDQSDGRIVLRLSGPNVRRILAKGVAIDLHPSVFAIGAASNLLCGHVSVNLARTGENEFELIVTRSLAESLFDDLRLMGREFGLSVDFSG